METNPIGNDISGMGASGEIETFESQKSLGAAQFERRDSLYSCDSESFNNFDQDAEPRVERIFPFLAHLDGCLPASLVDYLEELSAWVCDCIMQLFGCEYIEIVQETTVHKILKVSSEAFPILVTAEGDYFLIFEEVEFSEGAKIEIAEDRATKECGSELCTNTDTGRTVRLMRFSDFQTSKNREAKEFRKLIQSAKLKTQM